jgi:hypothetical protein
MRRPLCLHGALNGGRARPRLAVRSAVVPMVEGPGALPRHPYVQPAGADRTVGRAALRWLEDRSRPQRADRRRRRQPRGEAVTPEDLPAGRHPRASGAQPGQGRSHPQRRRRARGRVRRVHRLRSAVLPRAIEATLATLRDGADVVIGDRLHPESSATAPVGPLRRLSSAVYTWLVNHALGLDYADTQCGTRATRGGRPRAVRPPEGHELRLRRRAAPAGPGRRPAVVRQPVRSRAQRGLVREPPRARAGDAVGRRPAGLVAVPARALTTAPAAGNASAAPTRSPLSRSRRVGAAPLVLSSLSAAARHHDRGRRHAVVPPSHRASPERAACPRANLRDGIPATSADTRRTARISSALPDRRRALVGDALQRRVQAG